MATAYEAHGDGTDGPQHVTRYEDLRRHVTGHEGGHRLGLALFQREGMKAWLDAWSNCAKQAARPHCDHGYAADRSRYLNLNGDVGEIVRLLAGMAMGTLEEVPS